MLEPSPSFTGLSCTICTTYECNLRCKYDLVMNTKVLMSDFTEKYIQNVKAGDEIIGFTENPHNGLRKFEKAIVEAAGPTRKLTEAYKYTFDDNENSIIASGEHPFLNQNDEFQKTEDFYNSKEENKKVYKVVTDIGNNIIKREAIPVKIEKISIPETQFYNLTTSSRTFIANGIMVHNCYELGKHASRINIETVYKFIDLILTDPDPICAEGTSDNWITNSGIIIDFIGGDAFMYPDIMDKALSYFQYKAVMMHHPYATSWRASISSNGTLFGDPEVQRLIEKWGDNLSIGISIDGCKEIHDAYRIFRDKEIDPETGEEKEVGTMDTIMKWWPWIGERQPDAVNHTKSTCSKASIPWLRKSLQFMHEDLKMTYINQNFIMEDTGCEEDDYVLLDEMYRECAQYLFDHRHEMYWSMYDKSGIIRRSDNLTDHKEAIKKGWCGSGAMPTVGMGGKIYPCFRWLPHTQEDQEQQADEMCVGDVWNGFNKKENFRKVKENTREKISSHYCLECECEAACAYCIGGCYSEFHAFKRTEHICDITKLRSKWARRYWDMVEEAEHNHMDYFKDPKRDKYERRTINSNKVYRNLYRYDTNGNLKKDADKLKKQALVDLFGAIARTKPNGFEQTGHSCSGCSSCGNASKAYDIVEKAKKSLAEKHGNISNSGINRVKVDPSQFGVLSPIEKDYYKRIDKTVEDLRKKSKTEIIDYAIIKEKQKNK